MASERQLTVETALAILVPHFLLIKFVMPFLAQFIPALALNETDSVAVPSFRGLGVHFVGVDLSDPGFWVYLALLWLCFGVWVYFRREELRSWGEDLMTESNLDV